MTQVRSKPLTGLGQWLPCRTIADDSLEGGVGFINETASDIAGTCQELGIVAADRSKDRY